jgi:hypothetical protein
MAQEGRVIEKGRTQRRGTVVSGDPTGQAVGIMLTNLS